MVQHSDEKQLIELESWGKLYKEKCDYYYYSPEGYNHEEI